MTFCRTDHSKKKSHDIITDQALVAKILPVIIAAVYVIWFELCFSHEWWWLKQWQLDTLFIARKSHDYACDGINLSLSVRVWLKHSPVAFGMSWRPLIEYQQWASSYHGYVHCYHWWTSRDAHDILQHWWGEPPCEGERCAYIYRFFPPAPLFCSLVMLNGRSISPPKSQSVLHDHRIIIPDVATAVLAERMLRR